jgi:excisionase family DNA binding protein
MTSFNELPLIMSKDEVASLLRVSARMIDKMRVSGVLPSFRIGGAVRFHKADVINMIPARRA